MSTDRTAPKPDCAPPKGKKIKIVLHMMPFRQQIFVDGQEVTSTQVPATSRESLRGALKHDTEHARKSRLEQLEARAEQVFRDARAGLVRNIKKLWAGLGALRSKPNDHDVHMEHTLVHKAGLAPAALPATLDYRSMLGPVRNQGDKQGTCVAQVGACIKEWEQMRYAHLSQRFSPQFLYNMREEQQTPGMSARDMLNILVNYGDCLDSTYPYGTTQAPQDIPNYVLQEASHYRIRSYARISTIDGVKAALVQNGPVLVLVPCYRFDTRMWVPGPGDNPDDDSQLGHALAAVGYDANSLLLRNSWGRDFGDDGYCTLPYSEFRMAWEWWCAVDLRAPM